MLPIQNVEFLTRLRRRLGFRGDVSVRVDSTASPVVLASDVRGAPWRTEGRRWYVGAQINGAAGNRVEVTVNINAGVAILATSDSILINNPTASAVRYLVSVGGSCLLQVATDVAYQFEGASDAFTTAGTTNVPINLDARRDAQPLTAKIIAAITVPAGQTFEYRPDVILTGDNSVPLTISSPTAIGLDVWWSGQSWPRT